MHQITAAVLPCPHQVAGRLLLHARDRHLDDLAQLEQPRQAGDPACAQESGQSVPRRPHLVRHLDRAWQRLQPGPDVLIRRSQPAVDQLTGLTVKGARRHRQRVHVQPDTRTLILH